MNRGNDGGRAVVALVVVLCVAALFGGCEAEDPVVVNVSAAQARIILTFAENPVKAAGDFDLELTLSVQDDGQEPVEWQRTIAFRDSVAQGPLEVPSGVDIGLDAQTVIDGMLYVGYQTVPSLAPGTSRPVRLDMFPQR